MMIKKVLFYACLPVALLAACEVEQQDTMAQDQSDLIRLGYSVLELVEEGNTRASIGAGRGIKANVEEQTTNGYDQANIYIWDVTHNVAIGDSPNQPYAQLKRFREDAEIIQYNGFQNTLSYPQGCTHINIHAIWPLSVKNETTSFSVYTDQSLNRNLLLSELMFADVTNAERTMYPIMLSFKNKMARMTFYLTGSASSIIKTVNLMNVYTSCNIDPTNSKVGDVTGNKETIIVSKQINAYDGSQTTYAPVPAAVVFPPQTISAGTTFLQVVTTSNVTINFKLGADKTFLGGYNYVYNIVINETTDAERTITGTADIDETATAYYACTKTIQTFVVPETGKYKLEAWGAKGGNSGQTQTGLITLGGQGGYTSGNFELQKGTKLYVVCGEMGGDLISSYGGAGGYNGGGHGGDGYAWAGGGGGGGATHIALRAGLLSELENHKEEILMVAGGGGGGSYCPSSYRGYSNNGDGGEGGGEIAGNGNRTGSANNAGKNGGYLGASDGAGKDGSTYYGYAFGVGQPGRNSMARNGAGGEGGGGGGGGWYGGYSFSPGYYKILKYNSPADCLFRWVDESTVTATEKATALSTWAKADPSVDYKKDMIVYNTAQGGNTDTAGGGGTGYLNTSFSVNGNKYAANSGSTITGTQSIPSPTDPKVNVTGNGGDGAVRITLLSE